jgi:hypothetical protein
MQNVTYHTSTRDDRIKNVGELKTALRAIGTIARALATRRVMGEVFVCADTQEARDMVRTALVPQGFSILEPPGLPMHIGFVAPLSRSTQVEETRAVAREHLTLARADAIFMGSLSGFSATACAAALSMRTDVLCFLRDHRSWRIFQRSDV